MKHNKLNELINNVKYSVYCMSVFISIFAGSFSLAYCYMGDSFVEICNYGSQAMSRAKEQTDAVPRVIK